MGVTGPASGGRLCKIHGGREMAHSCTGTHWEPMGYCSAWDGAVDENEWPTCEFYPEEAE